MAYVVHVFQHHPVSRFYPYLKLPVGSANVTSIEMGAQFLVLKQEQRPDLADELLENEELKWNPERIIDWMKSKKVGFNVDIIRDLDRFYEVVLKEQFHKSSKFAKNFRDVLKDWDRRAKVQFRVYSGSGEQIMSSGLKFSSWNNEWEVHGFSVYGSLLRSMVLFAKKGSIIDNGHLGRLLTDTTMYANAPPKSVLVIMDSQGRYFDDIHLGDIVPISGGRYRDVLNVLQSGEYQLSDYYYIVIYDGTNEKTRWHYDWRERRDDFEKLRRFLIELSRSRPRGSIPFSCAFTHPTYLENDDHARYVEQRLQHTDILCLNWERPPGNPFLKNRRSVEKSLFQKETRYNRYLQQEEVLHFHLNHLGLREVWKRWTSFIPGLKFFPYTVTTKANSIKKNQFEPDDPTRYEFSRKRKFFE